MKLLNVVEKPRNYFQITIDLSKREGILTYVNLILYVPLLFLLWIFKLHKKYFVYIVRCFFFNFFLSPSLDWKMKGMGQKSREVTNPIITSKAFFCCTFKKEIKQQWLTQSK